MGGCRCNGRRRPGRPDAQAFAHWDTASQRWLVAAGGYQIMVGGSSRDIRLTRMTTLT